MSLLFGNGKYTSEYTYKPIDDIHFQIKRKLERVTDIIIVSHFPSTNNSNWSLVAIESGVYDNIMLAIIILCWVILD
jgi:hypothetical protein